jgi:hypothetical protein
MQADKWESGKVMVKKNLFSPALVVMATLTELPFLPFMNIILPVTVIACLFPLLFVFVFENAMFPVRRRMTGFALLPVTISVFRVTFVTPITGLLQFLVRDRPSVAHLTSEFAVLALENKLVFIVVKNRLFPVFRRMAGTALPPVSALVFVVVFVTSVACPLRLLLVNRPFVAFIASNLAVLAL